MRTTLGNKLKQAEAEALAEVFGGKGKASALNNGRDFKVVTHLTLSECHAALLAADLVVAFTRRLDADEPAGSGRYYAIGLEGLETPIIGIPTIEQAALRMAA